MFVVGKEKRMPQSVGKGLFTADSRFEKVDILFKGTVSFYYNFLARPVVSGDRVVFDRLLPLIKEVVLIGVLLVTICKGISKVDFAVYKVFLGRRSKVSVSLEGFIAMSVGGAGHLTCAANGMENIIGTFTLKVINGTFTSSYRVRLLVGRTRISRVPVSFCGDKDLLSHRGGGLEDLTISGLLKVV